MDQLSLVFFTVLAQCAVGIFLVTGCMRLVSGSAQTANVAAINTAQLFVWPLLAIAAVISTTHLGQPLRAFNVLFGAAHSSPLSLEIISMGAFGAVGVLYSFLSFRKMAEGVQKPLLMLAMILGVVFLLAITNVYTLDTVPTWNSGWTAFQFMATAGVLGMIGAAVLIQFQSGTAGEYSRKANRVLAVTGIVATVIAVVGIPMFLGFLGQLQLFENPLGLREYHNTLLMLRTLMLCVGMAIWVVPALSGKSSKVSVIAGMLLVLAAELAGRVFFYDVYLTTGM